MLVWVRDSLTKWHRCGMNQPKALCGSWVNWSQPELETSQEVDSSMLSGEVCRKCAQKKKEEVAA